MAPTKIRIWCLTILAGSDGLEADEGHTDRETLIRHLMEGQYSHPVRIVAFNTAEGWSRDVTAEIAEELLQRCPDKGDVPPSVQEFLDEH